MGTLSFCGRPRQDRTINDKYEARQGQPRLGVSGTRVYSDPGQTRVQCRLGSPRRSPVSFSKATENQNYPPRTVTASFQPGESYPDRPRETHPGFFQCHYDFVPLWRCAIDSLIRSPRCEDVPPCAFCLAISKAEDSKGFPNDTPKDFLES